MAKKRITITEDELREKLRSACKKAGSQKGWATENELSPAYVNDILRGKSISDRIAEKLGYKRVYQES